MTKKGTLKEGEMMPQFELEDQNGETVRSSDLLGKGPLVVYFYPHDETPGCTAEACAFRDAFEEFTDAGAMVVGISSDSAASHRKFAEHHRLPFILLSDPKGAVKDAFGVKSMLNVIPSRITFVIEPNGRITYVFSSLARAEEHVKRSLESIKDMAH
jgi:thioredoxin-dependent peroxiredoxin